MIQPDARAAFTERAALLRAVFHIQPRADGGERNLIELQARFEELVALAEGIEQTVRDENNRDMTDDELKKMRNYMDEADSISGRIDALNRVMEARERMGQSRGRQTDPQASDNPQRPVADSDDDEPAPARQRPQAQSMQPARVQTQGLTQPAQRAPRGTFGFRNLGDFAISVKQALTNQVFDPRLRAAATTYGSEGVGSDGGFAVPPDFRDRIVNMVMGEDTLFARTDNAPTSSNTVVVPKDETTAWGTSGVQVYTRAEAAAMSASKPKLTDLTVKLNEVYAFVPVTDELLEDAPLMANHLTSKAGDAINFATNNYIINGSGVGQPLGILNSACLVTVAAEGSQTADTIHALNIIKMWGRMPASVRSRAVWLTNQDAEVQLMQLGITTATPSGTATGGMPIYVPPGGLSAAPYATLLGRPVVTTEACSALGDVGDIILAYMGGYFMPYKAGGIKQDVSMHLYFDQGITAFRWTLRFGGTPWLSAPIGRKNGSNTLSHFVTLAAR